MSNQRIIQWFKTGRMEEAFLGKGEYFIPDVTYRDFHDTILVADAMLDWAEETDSSYVASQFEKVMRDMLEHHFKEGINMIIGYLIVIRERKGLPIQLELIKEMVKEAIQRNGVEISQDEILRGQILYLSKILPGIF